MTPNEKLEQKLIKQFRAACETGDYNKQCRVNARLQKVRAELATKESEEPTLACSNWKSHSGHTV